MLPLPLVIGGAHAVALALHLLRIQRSKASQVIAMHDHHPHEDVILSSLYKTMPPLLKEPCFPPPLNASPWTLIATREQLQLAVSELEQAQRVALDTEHSVSTSYAGQTALLQLSTGRCLGVLHMCLMGRWEGHACIGKAGAGCRCRCATTTLSSRCAVDRDGDLSMHAVSPPTMIGLKSLS
jgi:hypothetical protein